MRWLILILGFFLSGCIVHHQGRYQGPPPMLSTTMAQVNAMVGVQQPVAYKVGFRDGCDSGNLSAGNNSYIFKKDVERFNTDQVYQQGWNDGFNRCVSGEGVSSGSTSVNTYYGWGYYPGTFYSGYYYPSYDYYPYYSPGFSLWLGNYGHHDHYVHSDHDYYTPWYGGHKHRGGYRGGKHRGSGHGVAPYIRNQRGGGHKGGGHKGGGHKGGGHKGGGHKKDRGHKGLGGFIR